MLLGSLTPVARAGDAPLHCVLALLFMQACVSDAPSDPVGPDAGLGAFLDPCAATEDCASRLCIERVLGSDSDGFCTRACATAADCPRGDNWACLTPNDFADRVCACVPDSTLEICADGLDNDCDGVADDCRLCGGVPVPPDDPSHCGACFTVCRADQTCVDDACACREEGRVECGGNCVDPATNAAHCGGCDVACFGGQRCLEGLCECTDPRFPDACSGVGCVDLDDDAQHCGECGAACGGDRRCAGGECVCPQERPEECDGECVATRLDARHCGECGNRCGGHLVCRAGGCECADPRFTNCDGACVDRSRDARHCGACGVACRSGERCVDGDCVCDSGLVCAGRCVDAGDEANCGACGRTCGAEQTCSAGECLCAAAWKSPCGTDCVDLATDGSHCGTCTTTCRSTELCISGACDCAPGRSWCGEATLGSCVDLTTSLSNCGACGDACPGDTYCAASSCRCPVPGDVFCDAEGACIDLGSDESNCGACGNACPGGQICSLGECVCPESGTTYCASADRCVRTVEDESHCGACDAACAAGLRCIASSCRCPVRGDTYCDEAAECVNLAVDDGHCGSCGARCPSDSSCIAGTCACDDADLTACGEACVDLLADDANCGRCGESCGVRATCDAGDCYCEAGARTGPELVDVVGRGSRNRVEAMVSTGDRIGVLVLQDDPSENLEFSLRYTDGTDAASGFVAVTEYDSGSEGAESVVDARLAWSGTDFGVLYRLDRVREGDSTVRPDLRFLRIDSSGDLVPGSDVNLSEEVSSFEYPGRHYDLVHVAGEGFYAVLHGSGVRRGVLVLSLGDDASTLGSPRTTPDALPSSLVAAAANDGEIGVLTVERGDLKLYRFSSTGLYRGAGSYGPSSSVTTTWLSHDGTDWVAAWSLRGSTTLTSSVWVAYGDTMSTRYELIDDTSLSIVRGLVARTDDLVLLISEGSRLYARRLEGGRFVDLPVSFVVPDTPAGERLVTTTGGVSALVAHGSDRTARMWEVEFSDCPTGTSP